MAKSKLIKKATKLSNNILKTLDLFKEDVTGLIFLIFRIWIAVIFWQSGLTKIASWDTTLMLFEYEYAVPFFSVQFAALSATIIELTIPIFLIIGLGTRLATLPLLAMTAVIQFTYQANHEHVIWALLLLAILFHGAGRYSWDYFIRRKNRSDSKDLGKTSVAIAFLVTIIITAIAGHEVIAAFTEVDPWLDGMLKSWREFGK